MYIMAERKCSYPDPTPEKADPDHLIILFSSIFLQNPFSTVILLNDVQEIVDSWMLDVGLTKSEFAYFSS